MERYQQIITELARDILAGVGDDTDWKEMTAHHKEYMAKLSKEVLDKVSDLAYESEERNR